MRARLSNKTLSETQYPQLESIEKTQERLERIREQTVRLQEVTDSESESECDYDEQKKEICYRIKEDQRLINEAEKACKNADVQKDLNHLEEQLAKGNENPGIGLKPIGKGIVEHRAKNGGRLYVREVDGVIEILGKSGKNKKNQQAVIKRLKEIYG